MGAAHSELEAGLPEGYTRADLVQAVGYLEQQQDTDIYRLARSSSVKVCPIERLAANVKISMSLLGLSAEEYLDLVEDIRAGHKTSQDLWRLHKEHTLQDLKEQLTRVHKEIVGLEGLPGTSYRVEQLKFTKHILETEIFEVLDQQGPDIYL